MSTIRFKITNLTCAACVKLSTMALQKISGVASAAVDLDSGVAELAVERAVAWEEITVALQSVGKEAALLD